MGNRFSYDLCIFDMNFNFVGIDKLTNIVSDLKISFSDIKYFLDECGTATEFVSWDDHLENLIIFSKKYPNLIFELKCDDEYCDSWKEYVVNGKFQICNSERVYDQFDVEKLKGTDLT